MLGFSIEQIKCSGDRDILEAANLPMFQALKKLRLNWLTKRMGSDSFAICDK